jgi:hypothetical protein
MARLALSLVLVALAALAACTSYDPAYDNRAAPVVTAPNATTTVAVPATPVVTSSVPAGTIIVPAAATFRPGYGVIESITLVRSVPTASAGASLPERVAYRLGLRMDDGTLQAIDQDNRNFQVGDRVHLTNDGRVIRP